MIGSLLSRDLAPYAGLLVSFVLHATLLLSAVWLAERLGWLKHPAWAEWAWRLALFGAFVSVTVDMSPTISTPARNSSPSMTQSMPAAEGSALVADAAAIVSSSPDVVTMDDAPVATTAETHGVFPGGDQTPLTLPIASDALYIAMALWLAGMLLFLLRMVFQATALLRLRQRLVREGVPANDDAQRTLRVLAQEMRVREPMLRVLPDLPSPLVLPGAVLLPRWAGGLDARQLRAMLAHELAHLRRRDPLWRPLQRLALVPLFFHPLAWHALRRLETLAEHLCDAAAVERSGDGRALAECLAECLARSTTAGHDTNTHAHYGAGWALAMAERNGGIVDRVRTLLENSHMKLSAIPTRWRWTAGILALAALVALPGVVVVARPGMIARAFDQNDVAIMFRDKGTTYVMTSDSSIAGDTLHVNVDGEVVFNADESDIERMGNDASFVVEQRSKGVTRKLRVEPGKQSLQRTYTVNGAAHTYDAEAKAWLAATIPDMFRLSGAQADVRSKRLLAAGGIPRLLQEIGMLKNDSARGIYLGQLFSQATPDAAQTAQALSLLKQVKSDYEKRSAMSAVLSSNTLSGDTLGSLLAMAPGIESDFERAEWLIEAAEKIRTDGDHQALWSNALAAFDSDFERKRTLQAVIAHGVPRQQALSMALHASDRIGSDFERRSVLEDAAKAGVVMSDADYLSAVDGMNSDFEKREALLALLKGSQTDVARCSGVLRSVRAMSSDFERGEVLVTLAKKMPKDDALIEAYREVTRTMAEYERGQAEKALDHLYRG